MKKLLAIVAASTVMLLGVAVPALAADGGVCSGEKYDVEDLPATTSDGVVITLVDADTVHFDLPDGAVAAIVCVKAGSVKQGDGPEYIAIYADADVNHPSGKDISHASVVDVVFSPYYD
jgi:hypothetical protein